MTQDHHRLVHRFFDAVNEPATDRFDDIVAEDYHDHVEGQPRGRDALKLYFEAHFRTFPDLRMSIHAIVAEGNLIAVHSHLNGTQNGAMGPMPPTGHAIDVEVFQLYRVADGRLAEHGEVADVARMIAQLSIDPGALPELTALEVC